MFLATTALNQFWDTDQEIYFLSSGCLRYSERSTWESLQYEVMPSPWDDRQRFYDAAEYLSECYERILDRISQYLDSNLGVSHNKRYWRIILGPWLYHYVQTVYDRYMLLADAFDRQPGLQTITLDPRCFKVPRDMAEFTDFVCYDDYNLQIFSLLLQGLHGPFPTQTLESENETNQVYSGSHNQTPKNTAKSVGRFALNLVEKTISNALRKVSNVYLCGMNMPRSQVWGIARKTKVAAVPVSIKNDWSFIVPGPVFDELRNKLGQLDSSDEFESAFIQTLPYNFPYLYLEGLSQAISETDNKWRKLPSALVSLTGWYFTEPFKFLAAKGSEKGCQLIASQHGGLYGAGLLVPSEHHEIDISDSYMVWGWASEEVESQHNLPSPKLSRLLADQRKAPRRMKEWSILMVTTVHPRFLLRFQSFPVGSQWENYLQLRFRFLKEIPSQISAKILLRPGEKDYGWDIRSRTSVAFPQVGWDEETQFHHSLKMARMVISDYPGTTYLESMTCNVPTVLFWDPQRWEMRNEAEPYFEALREVGILWDSPEEAATHTVAVYENPWEWWGSQSVQYARQQFLDRFGLGRKDWAECWTNALQKVSSSAKGKVKEIARN